MERTQVEKRLGWLAGVTLIWCALILVQLVKLQVVHHQDYVKIARKTQTVEVKVPATRGSICDRNGRLLAMSTRLDTVYVNPLKVPDLDMASDILSRILTMNRAELYQRLRAAAQRRQGYMVVKAKISPLESERLRDLGLGYVGLERESQRHYPNDSLAAHVLGSVDFEEHGNGGIEQSMDDILHGEAGSERMLTDVRRRFIESHADVEAHAGVPLTLTIDERIQFVLEREVSKAVAAAHGKTGSGIAMNPYTGEIYALFSYPTYDPTKKPGAGESLSNRNNHCVSVPFEPGSVFKVITLSCALETTRLRPESMINCGNGSITLFGRTIHEAHGGYGVIPMAMVLAKSSNIGAIQIGMRAGQQNLYDYVRRFGFGQISGIELPAESKGMLRQMKHWGKTSLASIAMGHEISVTTVQLARACSVIANGGLLVKPRLLLRRGDEAVPVGPAPRILQPGTAITMRQMMEGVVLFGTGRQNAQLTGYSSGGKTGSAQIYDVAGRRFTHMYNATFMGFAPLANPAVVVVVTVNGTHMFGGTASAPAYKVIMEEALRVLKIPKDLPETLVADNKDGKADKHEILDDEDAAIADLASDSPTVLDEQPAEDANAPAPPVVLAAAAGPRVPDFQGKTMRAVVEEASAKGLAVLIDGSGLARMQQPPPGSVLRAGERIRVQFAR